MRPLISIFQFAVRLLFVVLLGLGIAFWTGRGLALIPLHMTLGIALVVCLWSSAVIAAIARAPAGPVAAGILWGALVVAFGMAQSQLLPGPNHWVVQTLHLLVGMGAIALNERLARLTLPRLSHQPVGGAS